MYVCVVLYVVFVCVVCYVESHVFYIYHTCLLC